MALPREQAQMLARLERSTRYLWAAQVAAGRASLDLGCGDGAGTSILGRAGSSPLVGIDSSSAAVEQARRVHADIARFEVAEPTALPLGDGELDLVTCFEALEASVDPEAVFAEIERVLNPEGLLLASLPASAEETLRRRFRFVELHEQDHYAGTAIDWPAGGEVSARTAGRKDGGRRSMLVAASNGSLPPLEPRATFEPISGVEAVLESLSQWESRAREAEAEVAVMRWEVRITGEKLVALVQRLVELENAPTRRLRRRLRAEPARVSAADITRAAEQE